jgi:hypothetical protein
MIRIRISSEALDDLDDGFWFYEAQDVGLGWGGLHKKSGLDSPTSGILTPIRRDVAGI